jgi:L-threonylcarbamoyladenylate synthase
MPSDTLYALCAAARDAAAVRRVFEIKGREGERALPLFVGDLAMAEHIGEFNDEAHTLAKRFWPGQLTIVVKKLPDYASEALASDGTVALRVPDHEVALAVVRGLGEAVTATSANLSGGPDPISAEEVRRQIGDRLDVILDAGPAQSGLASTIVDCTSPEPRVLRHGAIGEAAIADALKA